MPYTKRSVYRKRAGRTRKTTLKRRSVPSWKRTIGGFKAQGGTSIPRGIFPISVMKKLRYVDKISLNPTASSRDYHVFRANSIYDPDASGVGHQPRGTDQLMPTIYNHYTVVGSKMSVRYLPTGTRSENTNPAAIFWITMSTSTNPLASESADYKQFESGMIKNKRFVRHGDEGWMTKALVSSTFSAKKFFKCKSVVGISPYRALYNANPTEEAYFTVYSCAADPAVQDPPQFDLEVTIDYMVVFTEPNQVTSS